MSPPTPETIATTGLGLGLFLLAVGGREVLEAHLASHVLLQFPLLLAAGALLAGWVQPSGLDPWNRGGASGLSLAFAVLAFWMLPRAIDASVLDRSYALAKFASLPLAGAALAWSLPRLPGLVRAFLLAQLLAMSGAAGWLYLATPTRLCLAYRASEQAILGVALLLLAAGGVLAALVRALVGVGRSEPLSPPRNAPARLAAVRAGAGTRASLAPGQAGVARACSFPSSRTMRCGS